MSENKGQLIECWKGLIGAELKKEYFSELKSFLQKEKAAGKTIYPRGKDIFNAKNLVPVKNLKVVIVGQDPYINPNQAMGLCFSVPCGEKNPPSLVNIFKEIENDCGVKNTKGDLTPWAKQGVLLLNSLLTVEAGRPLSHAGRGWEKFFEATIKAINEKTEGIIFVLWGNNAKKVKPLIDTTKHFVLESSHPSPLGAHAGFFGCKHFSKINEILKKQGKTEIDWRT